MYYNIHNISKNKFLQIPFALIVQERYRELSSNDRIIYSVLFNRTQLSAQRNRVDEDGNIYTFYKVVDMANYLNLSESTVKRSYKTLEDLGLMDRIESPNNFSSFKKSFRIYLRLPEDGISTIQDIDEDEEVEENEESVDEVNNDLRGGQNYLSSRSKRTPSNKEYSNKEENKKERVKDSGASSHSIQRTLIDIPEKKELNRSETMLLTIEEAKAGRRAWRLISFEAFTRYYIHMHNQLMPNSITYKHGGDANKLRHGLIERYEIPGELVCDVIDKLLKTFVHHPKNTKGLLSLTAIEEQFFPEIILSVVHSVIPKKDKPSSSSIISDEIL